MCVVQPHTAVKVHESERDLHNLHTFEHRLSWLYTWPQQAKKGGKSKIYGANAPQLSAIWPQATTGTHVPPLHQRWRGGQGVRPGIAITPPNAGKSAAFSLTTRSRLLPAHSLSWDRSKRSGCSQIPVCRRRRVRAHNHYF